MRKTVRKEIVSPPRIARKYASTVRKLLHSHVKSIFLFGSHARGEGHSGSDYDFIIVLDKVDTPARNKVVDAGVILLNETNKLCAPLVYDPKQWELVRHSPLGWNIQKEGLQL